jgi:hypothetical protein
MDCTATQSIPHRVGHFRQKNYSVEDGIDRFVPAEFRLFLGTENSRNSVPNRWQRRKMLRILYHKTKIEANSRNSVLNHSTERKTLGNPFRTIPQRRKMLGIPFRGKKRSKLSEFRSKACLRQKHPVFSGSEPRN